MVYRIYVEKKPPLAHEAKSLLAELVSLEGLTRLTGLRILNRYDVENITEDLFEKAIPTVFSEVQLDTVTRTLDAQGAAVFAVEPLPGQYDQRADSAAQCIQILSCGERPTVRTARVYILEGELTDADILKVQHYVINPVESRLASLETYDTLQSVYSLPDTVPTLDGFIHMEGSDIPAFIRKYGLAMDADDLTFCRDYFRKEGRDPTLTEIRMIDTYWSDHCRHTTFLTTIDHVTFDDPLLESAYQSYCETRRELGRTKPQNLMDIATLATRYLKVKGLLPRLDESEEINACTVKIKVNVDGEEQDWLLLFKNETHNHPTEIEPFGGAATCIGGAIRDPLSGRSYVYAAMRVTGASDPCVPISETLPGKLSQRKIVTTAAAGYSSYGNQIGLATGQVDEIYHPGYAAKRMEIGAVIAATPAGNVRRECPVPGDAVILLGGRTGRDGCGGATGSSKSHTATSLETCGAEVQKGNAPEERKLQRLFRRADAARMIKRCNDFGAGGVSVAIGELADGLDIRLDAVPKKYDGLDGTELAISESQERMAVVVAPEDVAAFCRIADEENLEATEVAVVTAEPRLRMHWKGHTIVDISREFLNSNGAEKHIDILPARTVAPVRMYAASFPQAMRAVASDLNTCSKRGLAERFDSTIGAGTVLMPFGGTYQVTPPQAMVHKISVEKGHTDTVSLMAFGYNPFISSASPYHGAYLAVLESVCRLIATGASFDDVYLTLQEYFEKPLRDPKRWGKPLSALLGAFRAQMDYGIAAIGGKDSMSGSFEKLDVPPTLVSFAVTTGNSADIVPNYLKAAGHALVLLTPDYDEHGLPTPDSEKALFARVTSLLRSGAAVSAYTPGMGGVAEATLKMALGERIGVRFADDLTLDDLFGYRYGAFLLEVTEEVDDVKDGIKIGETISEPVFRMKRDTLTLTELQSLYDARLEAVFPTRATGQGNTPVPTFSYPTRSTASPAVKVARPRVLIPVFPGTNCEYDTAKAMRDAGAEPEIFVIRNMSSAAVSESVEAFARRLAESQIVFIPGGFSGGDEPDGSGKFITAFFRSPAVADEVEKLLYARDGLMAGICNGFQALIKLGLVPYGHITAPDPHAPTLTYNIIGRHQSRLVRTRVASVRSPWLTRASVGDVYTVPISHGEGRFLAAEEQIRALAENGQVITQYVDLAGVPTMDIDFNPNGSVCAVEGICSPDGRVIGKMGHSERKGHDLYRNVSGRYDMGLFESAVDYYKL